MSEPIKKKKKDGPEKQTTTRAGRVKKDKKAIQVVAVVTPDGIEGTFTPEPRKPLIIHLPFNSSEIEFNDTSIRYDPNPPVQPEPYTTNDYFQVNSEGATETNQIGVEQSGWKMETEKAKQEEQKTKINESESIGKVPIPTAISIPTGPQKLLNCYAVKTGEAFNPPETTEICCFWCTNTFNDKPFFLPAKEESNLYHVYGNFCCVECALTYLLKESLDTHIRWERVSLLHRMYKVNGRIYPAPPRESLTKYGGVYSYEQFKQIIDEKKVRVDISVPPMVSILGTLDTKPIDFYEANIQTSFANSFSLDRFRLWSEQGGALRLKRSKPLKDKDSTLDSCMNISVKRANETALEF
jgi:hypothetical protein